MTIAYRLLSHNLWLTLGLTIEHTSRSYLQNLLDSFVAVITRTNQSKSQTCGEPDSILMNIYLDVENEFPLNFCTGGYQLAQNRFKETKSRVLEFEEIMNSKRIIETLIETSRLMNVIDKN
jgi:hypothetical protein